MWLLFSFFFCFWILIHFFCRQFLLQGSKIFSYLFSYGILTPPIDTPVATGEYFNTNLPLNENSPQLRNLCRLIRSQIYCLTATIGGLYSLLVAPYSHQWPSSFVSNWISFMDYLFCSAIAHWVLSILEDLSVGNEIYRSTNLSSQYQFELYLFFIVGLISHHFFAIFAYYWCMHIHHLSGLAVLGCLYEFPVLLLNYREMAINYPQLFPSGATVFTSRTSLTIFWILLHISWHFTRTLGCILYIVSLILWRNEIAAAIPPDSLIVYHLLGIGFNYINLVLLFTVLLFYLTGDFRRIQDMSQSSPRPVSQEAPL